MLLAAGLVLWASAGSAAPARANGVPQLVKLTYLAGVSNFGPREGEGVLEFSFAEAYARVDVKNLPPSEGYVYEGWLVAPGGDSRLVGPIPTDPAGIGGMETKLEGLDSYDYNLFVVAARGAADAPSEMPSLQSIAGRFAVIQDDGGVIPGDSRPQTLPDTGERPSGSARNQWGAFVTAGSLAASAALIFFSARRKRAKERT
jgi:hypothetical protein